MVILTCWWPELVAVGMWSRGSFNGVEGCFNGSLDKGSATEAKGYLEAHERVGRVGRTITGLSSDSIGTLRAQ